MDLGVRDEGYLIVGGTAGMGFEAARALAADGARIAVCGRDAERAKVAADADRLPARGSSRRPLSATSATVRRRPSASSRRRSAALGGLAGMAVTTGTSKTTRTARSRIATDEVWAEAVDDVLMSVVRTVKAVLRATRRSRFGDDASATSAYEHPLAAREPHAVCRAQGCDRGVHEERGQDLPGAPASRANCVCPGAIETGGLATLRTQIATSDRGRRRRAYSSRSWSTSGTWTSLCAGRENRRKSGSCSRSLLSPRAGYLDRGHDQHRRRHRLLRRSLSRPGPGGGTVDAGGLNPPAPQGV